MDHFYLTETRNLNFFVSYSRTKYHMNSFSIELSDTGTVSPQGKPQPVWIHYWAGHCHILVTKSFYFFYRRKCRVFNFIIIYDHPCLNKHHFYHFLAVPRQRLPVIISNRLLGVQSRSRSSLSSANMAVQFSAQQAWWNTQRLWGVW